MKKPYVLGNCGKILIRLGEGCDTGCVGCKENYISKSYTPSHIILKNISRIHTLFHPDVEFLFFGVDPLFHPHLITILEASRKSNKNTIYFHISHFDLFDSSTFSLIKYIHTNYSPVKFLVSQSIEKFRIHNYKKMLEIYSFFVKYNISLSVQIYYSDKYSLVKERNLRALHFFPHIELDISKNLYIDTADKSVHSEDMSCKFFNTIDVSQSQGVSFDIDDTDNYELEISINGDIRPHTPRCYIANIYISNIFFDRKTIMSHFLQFKKNIINIHTLHFTFQKNCFECMYKGKAFDYRNNS